MRAKEIAQFRILSFFRIWVRTLISHKAPRYHIMSQDSHLSHFFIINALVFVMLSVFVVQTKDQKERKKSEIRRGKDVRYVIRTVIFLEMEKTCNFKGFTLSSTLSSQRIVQWITNRLCVRYIATSDYITSTALNIQNVWRRRRRITMHFTHYECNCAHITVANTIECSKPCLNIIRILFESKENANINTNIELFFLLAPLNLCVSF